MSTCDEPCDHLFEAATLSAQLVEAETERDDARAQLAALTATHERARGLLLDGTLLVYSSPEARGRWKARVEASDVLRVTPAIPPPGGARPACDITGCTNGPGHYHELDGKTYYYPKTWTPAAERGK